MARAGFYPIQSARIRFGRDGRWYADGEVIANERISRLFSRHLQREPDGTFVIRLGPERAVVEVEDTPFVVTTVTVDSEGIRVQLNDGTEHACDPGSFTVGEDGALSCRVAPTGERVRLLRAAQAQLMPFVEQSGGAFAIRFGDRLHAIAGAGLAGTLGNGPESDADDDP